MMKRKAIAQPRLLLEEINCTGHVRRRAVLLKRPFVTATFCFDIRQQPNRPFPRTTSQITVLRAVDF